MKKTKKKMKKKKLTKEGKKQQRKIANLKKKLNSAHGTIDDLNVQNEALTVRLADKKVKTRNDKEEKARRNRGGNLSMSFAYSDLL